LAIAFSRRGDVMRSASLGLVLGASLVLLLWGVIAVQPQAHAQRPAVAPVVNYPDRAPASSELIALSFDAGGGRQHITLIDPRTHMVGVYAIDPATGEIALRSVRNVHWDLQMDEFNGTTPSPREIRSLLGNK
jgi:hypothetical protein